MGTTARRSVLLRHFLIIASMCFATSAFADQNLKSTYNITDNSAAAKTVLKHAPADLDGKLKEKMWELFAQKLKEMPMVGDIQTSSVTEKKTDPGTWSDSMQLSRTFSAFVQIKLQKPVTLLFSVEQTYNVCKTQKELQLSDATTSSDSTCNDVNTTLNIKGPIAVYGTFQTESNMDITGMLRDKQRLTVNVSRSYDKADLEVDSTLYVDSLLFEKSLLKFFDIFNVSGISKKAEDLTRQNIFLGAARVMRQSNERMLEL